MPHFAWSLSVPPFASVSSTLCLIGHIWTRILIWDYFGFGFGSRRSGLGTRALQLSVNIQRLCLWLSLGEGHLKLLTWDSIYWLFYYLVTYHLIFAITGLVFCCLNSAINIMFYFVQSKVKHNDMSQCFSEDDISDDAWKLVDLDIFMCCRTFCCLIWAGKEK